MVPPESASEATAKLPVVLAGLESLDLAGREKRLFSLLISQIYSPCADQTATLLECIQEARPCGACKPAVLLLASKIKEGATADQLRDLYALRFGADRKVIDPADSPSRGASNAPVTIVVWSDFECPACRHAMPILARAVEKHAPHVRLIHKFYPLRQHAHAEEAARAAIAAHNQNKYWEMEEVLFAHQDAQSEKDLVGYAKDLKLDLKRFVDDLAADRTNQVLARDHRDADQAGLSATPFILINGRKFELDFFHFDSDLDPWIDTEVALNAAPKR